MTKTINAPTSKWVIFWNKVKTFFQKPQNSILVIMGLVCTFTTLAPIIAIIEDTLKIHPGTIDQNLTGLSEGFTIVNYTDLFTSSIASKHLWEPLLNTVVLAVLSCLVAILYGGIFAFLVTRTHLVGKKYLSAIFIFPYIMPQWTLATVWKKCKYCPKQYQTTATDLSYICPDCKKKFSGKVL